MRNGGIRKVVSIPPPESDRELWLRALGLVGESLGNIAARLGLPSVGAGTHAKGKIGKLIERALGAQGGQGQSHDFPALGIEVKTVPVSEDGVPKESTFVCSLSLRNADRIGWEESWVRRKLGRVLFVPIITPQKGAWYERRVGLPVLWSPSPEEEATLRADFEEIMGLIGIGGIEEVGGHIGTWLHVRPKSQDGRPRTWAYGPEGESIPTVPRGFYLRRSLVMAILKGERPKVPS